MSSKLSDNSPEVKHQIGAVLTKLMHKKNMDESTLAKACNISLASLSRIKNNPESNPTISTLRPIAEFFNITIDQLLGYTPIKASISKAKNIALIQNNDVFNWLKSKTTSQPIINWLSYEHEASDKTFAITIKLNYNTSSLPISIIIVDPKKVYTHNDLIYIYNKKLNQFFIREVSIDDHGNTFIKPIEQGFSDYIPLDNCSSNITIIGVVLETRLMASINNLSNQNDMLYQQAFN